MPKPAKSEFISNILSQRKKRVDKIVLDTIADCVAGDLPVYDQYYIDTRLREVMENMLLKVDFVNKEMAKLRLEFLRQNLKEAVRKLPTQQTFGAPKDLTEARNRRCESIVYKIAERILTEEILLGEPEYIEHMFTEQNAHSLHLQISGILDSFFSLLEMSMERHLDLANEYLWKGKTKDEITFKQVDEVLKEKERK